MIIKYGDMSIVFPIEECTVLVNNDYAVHLAIVDELYTYFNLKRKVNSTFIEKDGEIINKDKYYYINYTKLIEKEKYTKELEKEMMQFLENIITENPEQFKSVFEYITSITLIKNDIGFIKIARQLLKGIDFKESNYYDYKLIPVKELVKYMTLSIDMLNYWQKILIYVNMQIFKNKDKIVLVHFELLNDEIYQWIKELKSQNVKIILCNEKITKNIEQLNFTSIAIVEISKQNKFKVTDDIEELYYYSLIWSKKYEIYKKFLA